MYVRAQVRIPPLPSPHEDMHSLGHLPGEVLKQWEDLSEAAPSTDPKLQFSYIARLGWPCTDQAVQLHGDMIRLCAPPATDPSADFAVAAMEHMVHLLVTRHLSEINSVVRNKHFTLQEVGYISSVHLQIIFKLYLIVASENWMTVCM